MNIGRCLPGNAPSQTIRWVYRVPRATETISIKLCAKQYFAKGNPVLNRIQIHYLGKIIKSYWNIFIKYFVS